MTSRGGHWHLLAIPAIFSVALAVRLWTSTVVPLDPDEAVQGIAALELVRGGEFRFFFPGQAYGGTLEVLLQAPFQWRFPGSVLALRLPLMLLTSASCALLVPLLRAMTGRLRWGVLAGALAAVVPMPFVVMGVGYPGGYAGGIFLATLGAVLAVRFVREPTIRSGLAPSVLFALAVYSQPVMTWLIVPVVLMLPTLERPSVWRCDWARLRRRRVRELRLGRVALALIPMVVVLAAERIISVREASAGRIFDPSEVVFDRATSVAVTFGLTTWPEMASDPSPFDINEPATWALFGLSHLPRPVAVAASVALWLAVVVAMAAAIAQLLRREPGARWARIGAAAFGVAAVGVIAAVTAVALPSYGRYGFAAAFVMVAAVTLVVSQFRGGGATVLACVIAGLAVVGTALTLHRASPAPSDEAASGEIAALADGRPLVGAYEDVYPIEFLSGGAVTAIAFNTNRFPERLTDLDPGSSTEVLVVIPVREATGRVGAAVIARCHPSGTERVPADALLELTCPDKALTVGAPRAHR